jgi:hypothetical protein
MADRRIRTRIRTAAPHYAWGVAATITVDKSEIGILNPDREISELKWMAVVTSKFNGLNCSWPELAG